MDMVGRVLDTVTGATAGRISVVAAMVMGAVSGTDTGTATVAVLAEATVVAMAAPACSDRLVLRLS